MKITDKDIAKILDVALPEDIESGDITSELVIPEDAKADMVFTAREDMVMCGMPVLEYIYSKNELKGKSLVSEGDKITPGTEIFKISGNARYILATERTTLNLMQRMSGIATITNKYVEKVRHTKAKILDTRKTVPGLRILDKYAVHTGGGVNHRIGLYDGILIKDNHIAIAGGITEAIKRAKENRKDTKLKIQIECDTLEQVEEAINSGAEIILLDNMPPDTLREAVRVADGKIPLEASGGITLETVKEIAETGVDYISIGSLTHSVKAVDIGLDFDNS